jgi:hypothetical protein
LTTAAAAAAAAAATQGTCAQVRKGRMVDVAAAAVQAAAHVSHSTLQVAELLPALC